MLDSLFISVYVGEGTDVKITGLTRSFELFSDTVCEASPDSGTVPGVVDLLGVVVKLISAVREVCDPVLDRKCDEVETKVEASVFVPWKGLELALLLYLQTKHFCVSPQLLADSCLIFL
jgi:hypothetical protein